MGGGDETDEGGESVVVDPELDGGDGRGGGGGRVFCVADWAEAGMTASKARKTIA